jgi:hypothetical protein
VRHLLDLQAQLAEWRAGVDRWLDQQEPSLPADLALRRFISLQLYEDACTLTGGVPLIVTWLGRHFPGSSIRGARFSQNVVENHFSRLRSIGANTAPNALEVAAGMTVSTRAPPASSCRGFSPCCLTRPHAERRTSP